MRTAPWSSAGTQLQSACFPVGPCGAICYHSNRAVRAYCLGQKLKHSCARAIRHRRFCLSPLSSNNYQSSVLNICFRIAETFRKSAIRSIRAYTALSSSFVAGMAGVIPNLVILRNGTCHPVQSSRSDRHTEPHAVTVGRVYQAADGNPVVVGEGAA